MTSLLVVLLLTADKGASVHVDSVTVNGEKQEGNASGSVSTLSGSGQQWSVVTARTAGRGGKLLEGTLGFPGIAGTFLYGVQDNFDVGGRVTFNYGWEGQINSIKPGLKLQFVGRYKFLDTGKVNLGLHFEPGVLFYFPRGPTQPGFAFGVGLDFGIIASSAVNIGLHFDMPMWVLIGPYSSLVIPVLFGAGMEYFFTSSLAFLIDLRMGPTIWAAGGPAVFTFEGKAGVGWRF